MTEDTGSFDRRLSAVAGVSAAVLFAPLAWLIVSRRLLTQLDLAMFNIPVRHLYQDALRAGDSIWWTPSLFAGYFIHGDGQVGAAHPLHLLLYRWLPLDVAVNLEMSSSYAFGVAGMLVLQRRLGLSRPAALVGAILFAFGGFNLLHLNHLNAVAVMAHAPWMFAAIDMTLLAERRSTRTCGAVAFAALLGSQLLLGYPQYVWITILGSAAFAAVRVQAGPSSRTMWSGIVSLLAAVAVGTLIGGAQLLPHVDAVRESLRGAEGLAYTFSFSLYPWNLVQLWTSNAFVSRIYSTGGEVGPHEFGLYDGAFASASLMWLLARRRELGPVRTLATGLAWCLGLFVLLAFGRYGGIDWLFAYTPVIRLFRAPARYIAMVHLFLALLAGIAFDDLAGVARRRESIRLRRLWPLAALLLLSLVTVAAELIVRPPSSAQASASAAATLTGFTIVAATIGVIVLCARRVRWAPALLVPICALDLALSGWTFVWRPPPMPLSALTAQVALPRGGSPPATLFDDSPLTVDLVAMRGGRLFNGYVGMWPDQRLPWWNPIAQRLGGVKWKHDADGWQRADEPMPRARLVSDVRASDDLLRDVAAIDISRTALVQGAHGAFDGPPGTASVVIDRPGRIEVAVSPAGRQLLVLTESFHHGWRATVDGRPADTIRVYGDRLGVAIDRGAARVLLRFTPASVRVGIGLSVAGLLIAGVWLVWGFGLARPDGAAGSRLFVRGRRRESSSAPPPPAPPLRRTAAAVRGAVAVHGPARAGLGLQ